MPRPYVPVDSRFAARLPVGSASCLMIADRPGRASPYASSGPPALSILMSECGPAARQCRSRRSVQARTPSHWPGERPVPGGRRPQNRYDTSGPAVPCSSCCPDWGPSGVAGLYHIPQLLVRFPKDDARGDFRTDRRGSPFAPLVKVMGNVDVQFEIISAESCQSCVESLDMSGRGEPRSFCSRDCGGWNTAAMTAPASARLRPTARSSSRRHRGGSTLWRQEAIQDHADGSIGIGHTRWATHGPATQGQRAPALRRHAVDRGGPQRCDRELPASEGPAD